MVILLREKFRSNLPDISIQLDRSEKIWSIIKTPTAPYKTSDNENKYAVIMLLCKKKIIVFKFEMNGIIENEKLTCFIIPNGCKPASTLRCCN